MLISKTEEFSDKQAITATAYGVGIMDLGPNKRDVGVGEPGIYLITQLTETATAAGAATVDFQLVTSDNADLSGHEVVVASGAKALAAMTQGDRPLSIQLPSYDYKRYLGMRYVVATGPLTAGKVAAFLTPSREAYRAYERNYRNDAA